MFAIGLLLALVVYGSVAWLIARAVGKYTKSRFARYGIVTIFVLIPTWDIIPGRLYFQHLCESEVGVNVLKTVEVDAVSFLPDGRPDEKKLGQRLESSSKINKEFSELFHIWKVETALKDKTTNQLLGTSTSFTYYGGWVFVTISSHMSSTSCPRYGAHGQLLKQAVRPRNAP